MNKGPSLTHKVTKWTSHLLVTVLIGTNATSHRLVLPNRQIILKLYFSSYIWEITRNISWHCNLNAIHIVCIVINIKNFFFSYLRNNTSCTTTQIRKNTRNFVKQEKTLIIDIVVTRRTWWVEFMWVWSPYVLFSNQLQKCKNIRHHDFAVESRKKGVPESYYVMK